MRWHQPFPCPPRPLQTPRALGVEVAPGARSWPHLASAFLMTDPRCAGLEEGMPQPGAGLWGDFGPHRAALYLLHSPRRPDGGG